MYTSWVTNVRYLSENCPNARMLHNDYHCSSHLPSVSNYSAFMKEAKAILSKNNDEDSYLVRVGSYSQGRTGEIAMVYVLLHYRRFLILFLYYTWIELTDLEIEIFKHSKWSGVIFQPSDEIYSSQVLDENIKDSSRRSKWLTIEIKNICDSSSSSFNFTSMLLYGLSSPQPHYTSVLDRFKEINPKAGKKTALKHWQVVGIIIDMPYRQRVFDDAYSGIISFLSSSLSLWK